MMMMMMMIYFETGAIPLSSRSQLHGFLYKVVPRHSRKQHPYTYKGLLTTMVDWWGMINDDHNHIFFFNLAIMSIPFADSQRPGGPPYSSNPLGNRKTYIIWVDIWYIICIIYQIIYVHHTYTMQLSLALISHIFDHRLGRKTLAVIIVWRRMFWVKQRWNFSD